jgi:IS1 family transposase
MSGMNKLPRDQRSQIIALLCEGNSMSATARLADVSFNTVTKLLIDAGQACSEYQDKTLRGIRSQRVQVDEIWSFIGMKNRNVPKERKGEAIGDVWVWTALDADTKLMITWLVGDRTSAAAKAFMLDLASRLRDRIQLTSDGLAKYEAAVREAFKGTADYAMLEKQYTQTIEGERRYSPPVCTGARKRVIFGNPDETKISTSFVERQNLTMRMSMRRFTRLTNAFSKKLENHAYAVSLHYMFYNFARIHKTLRVTPAMAAGVSDKVWSVGDIVDVVDAWYAAQTKAKRATQEWADERLARKDAVNL